MRAVVLALAVWAAPMAAGAREVHTGASVSVDARGATRYEAVYWVEPRGDEDVEVVGLPAPTGVGAFLDVVHEHGCVARVRVVSLEQAVCGELTYVRARARAPWPGLGRDLVGGVVALGPARGHPPKARV